MDPTNLIALLQSSFPESRLEAAPSVDQATICLDEVRLVGTAKSLKESLGFVMLADMTAVDWWPKVPRFEVVYHLSSAEHRLRLKVKVDGESPHLPTVRTVWPSAGWLEREIWDMFGIVFDGHDDLRRLLMPHDWEGHPLRKDYPVQIRLKPRTAEPLQVSEEEFRANLEADRAVRSTRPVPGES